MLVCRPMTSADIPAAAAIEAAVFDSWSAETIALTLASPTSHCFVAVERGDAAAGADAQKQHETVCGFCACTLVADTSNLDAVSVAPDCRRRGAGRALVTHAMHVLHGAGAACMWLEVRSQNVPALTLYTALGFVQNGLRRGFYENPQDDAVLMTAALHQRNNAT